MDSRLDQINNSLEDKNINYIDDDGVTFVTRKVVTFEES